MIKSVKLKKSTRKGKKHEAVFTLKDGRKKTTHFGAAGMSDFTIHRDKTRKKNYIARHRKNENWDDPFSAGALSRYILWNKETKKDSLADFKRRFKIR